MQFLTAAHPKTHSPRRIYRGVMLCALLCATSGPLALTASANDLPREPAYQSERTANNALGIAAYASYTNQVYANAEAANLERVLGESVQIRDVVVDGVSYLRLQSAAKEQVAARALVNKARQAGYASWFVATTSAAPAASVVTTVAESASKTETENALSLSSTPSQLLLTPDNPELALQLPEGPLLGELFPPRAPLPAR